MKQWNWKLTAALAVLGFAAGLCWPQTAQYAKPDRKLTPGVVDATIEADLSKKSYIVNDVERNICASDFVTPPFRVATKSEKIKTAVCKAYGIDKGCPGADWELDDIIPVELGGKNVEANLWPQPIKEARVKDHRVEDVLGGPRGLVCQGKIALKTAQACVLDDWVKCMDVVAKLRETK